MGIAGQGRASAIALPKTARSAGLRKQAGVDPGRLLRAQLRSEPAREPAAKAARALGARPA